MRIILKEMGEPTHPVVLWRNAYANQKVAVKTGFGATEGFDIGKDVRQGCILSPLLFNYAEKIMREALDKWEGGICIGERIVTNLIYTDDTTIIAGAKEDIILSRNHGEYGKQKTSFAFHN